MHKARIMAAVEGGEDVQQNNMLGVLGA